MDNKKSFRFGERFKLQIVAALVAAAVCLISGTNVWAMPASDIGVTIDEEAVVFQNGYGKPFIDENDRTLVPLRGVMEAFGAAVSWNNDARTADIVKDGTTVRVPVGQAYITVNGIQVINDTSAVIRDNRIYLPVRVVLEAFGACVAWDNYTRTVVVMTGGPEEPAAENPAEPAENENTLMDGELRAMWISYLEYMEMPKDQAGFKAAVDKMFDRCVDLGMNAVIVHVRSHCDAMYPSVYFPWSAFAGGTQGVDPGYDPLEYMISAAHSRKLQFNAWINPYRVTGYGNKWAQVAAGSPAKLWLSDDDSSNDRWVLLHKGEYYLNPSVSQVRQMIVDGVREIIFNYDVDGIHFDDYFYPSVNDSVVSLCFDKPEYDASGSALSIADWRRHNVNVLVKDIYAAIKEYDPNIVFGISPLGNLENLRRNDAYFVDIDTWLSNPRYVDYIMPQLYWGFEARDSSGNIAAYAYENNLKAWLNLTAMGDTKLCVGLNMANAGTDVSDRNAVSEWLCHDDIIARQVQAARATGKVDGFAFFRYGMFNRSQGQNEVLNLIEKLRQ